MHLNPGKTSSLAGQGEGNVHFCSRAAFILYVKERNPVPGISHVGQPTIRNGLGVPAAEL